MYTVAILGLISEVDKSTVVDLKSISSRKMVYNKLQCSVAPFISFYKFWPTI